MVDPLLGHIFGIVYTKVGHRGSCLASNTKLSTVEEFDVGQGEQRVVLSQLKQMTAKYSRNY